MMMIQSDDPKKLDEMPAGTRLFLVNFYDPATMHDEQAVTSLGTSDFEWVDQQCKERNLPFGQGLLLEAAAHVMARAYPDGLPPGAEVRWVHEVSKREVLEMVQRDRAAAAQIDPETIS